MTHEALDIIHQRLINPEALGQLAVVRKAVDANSPILGKRYMRLLAASGVWSNPELTAAEKSILTEGIPLPSDGRDDYIRLRLTSDEKERLRARASAADKTISAYIRDELCK